MTKRVEQFILNEIDGSFDINRNKRISKDDCVKRYEQACFDRDCIKVSKEKNEECIKYSAKFNDRIPLEITIDTKKASKEINKKYIERLNHLYILKRKSIDRVNDVKKMKFFIKAGIILGGYIALSKMGPGLMDKLRQNDNERFAIEQQEAKEMKENLEIKKNHEEAMEHYYYDKEQENIENQNKSQKLKKQIDSYNQEKTQKMIDDMIEYRDLDTMPNVERIR